MVAEAVAGTLDGAGVAAEDVAAIHVGNAFGQLFTGQGQLGAMPATVEPRLWGKPAARHEAACASGSVAVLAATADIEAGRYDCVLVIAVEQERNVPGAEAPRHLGAAAWIGHEGQDARFMWPYMFSQLADEYDRRYGLNDAHLHAIAELNMRNARTTRWPRPAAGRSARAASPTTTTTTRSSRGGCGAPTAPRSPTASRACCWSPTVTGPNGSAENHRPGSPAGGTAPPGWRCSPSSTAARASRTSSRTSARSSPTRSGARASATSAARRHRDPRLLLDVGVHGHRSLRHHRTRRELEGGRERRARAGRRDPGQPERRPDRRGSPGGRHRRAHAARRRPAGDRPGRRLPGRRGQDLRHAEHRRQPHHHGQLRRHRGQD